MRPVRFIHTSDIHLDTSFSAAGLPSRLGDRKREAIRATLKHILEDACSSSLDFVLVAGDLFEHDRVVPDTVQFLKCQFAAISPVKVFVAPGNHDPCVRDSPYNTESWPDNVHIFRKEEFGSIELPEAGVRITGFGFNRAHLTTRVFQQLSALPPDLVNVVVAHGSDLARVPAGKAVHCPFTMDELVGKNVRYFAFGHYHQQREVARSGDGTRVWYAGIPEGRGWDEEGECGYLLVEIEGDDTRVVRRPSAQFPLKTLRIECDGLTNREQIIEELLKGQGDLFDANSILRVQLVGAVDPRLDLSIPEMGERLSGAALYIQWDDRTEPAVDLDVLARENTLVGRFVREINARISGASGAELDALERARLYGSQSLLGRGVRLK